MTKFLRLVLFSFIIFLKTSPSGFAQDKSTETVPFPDQTINEYKIYLTQENKLDSAVLSSAEFKDFVKEFRKEEGKVGGFHFTEDLTRYFDYVRTQDILIQLIRIEQKKEDSLILNNIRFKMQVEMANFPISYTDLQFVYRNLDLFSKK
jgi:hypothetical protein